jgi:hypothetical protein
MIRHQTGWVRGTGYCPLFHFRRPPTSPSGMRHSACPEGFDDLKNFVNRAQTDAADEVRSADFHCTTRKVTLTPGRRRHEDQTASEAC